MHVSWLVRLRSITYALLVNVLALSLLLLSFDFAARPIRPQHQNINIVNAVAIDKKEVEQELQRLKSLEEEKKQAEQKRIAELEKQAQELKKLRAEEEQKLEEARKKKEVEQKHREEEQKKVAELEKQRKTEEAKKKQVEAERKKAEAEKKRLEEEKRLAEEEKKRLEAERKLQEQLTEEQRRKEEEEKKRLEAERKLQEQLDAEAADLQRQQDLTLQQQIERDIYNKVSGYFNRTGLPEGLSCKLNVKLLPGGDVVSVTLIESSGNERFDRQSVIAVEKASPLPVPDDLETFERLELRDNTFTFKPEP